MIDKASQNNFLEKSPMDLMSGLRQFLLSKLLENDIENKRERARERERKREREEKEGKTFLIIFPYNQLLKDSFRLKNILASELSRLFLHFIIFVLVISIFLCAQYSR